MALFKPGQSGNPKGRTPGVKNRSLGSRKLLNDLIETEGPAVLRALIRAAKNGDVQAGAEVLARWTPKLKPVQAATPVPLDPEATDIENRAAIIGAIAAGTLSIDDGASLLRALGIQDSVGSVLNIRIDLGKDDFFAPLPIAERVVALPAPEVQHPIYQRMPTFAIDEDEAP